MTPTSAFVDGGFEKLTVRRLLAALAATLSLALCFGAPGARATTPNLGEQRTARYVEAIRNDPTRLRAFLAEMPKGGDLHNHLSGAVPTETLIRLAIDDGLCIDTTTLVAQFKATPSPGLADTLFGKPACPSGQRPIADSSSDSEFYQQILRAWSMEGFQPGAETGHDHFFATFGKFGAATERKGDMLAAVASVNAEQNVLYLETLVSRQYYGLRELAKQVSFDPDFAAMRNKLLESGMAQVVSGAIAETDGDRDRFDDLLGCRTPQPQPACGVTIRYDYQVGRATDPVSVFTGLLLGFELQNADPRYVGVNLVQPEDNAIALRDYTLHMRMIQYLRSVYPNAHVTLHAGELAPGLVEPADLSFHIRQAVEIAGAERIGHSVDVLNETNYLDLLRTMARRHVLVEAPLTSNAQILGVSGSAHPFNLYRAASVPVALATDDPGVSRIDITHEYQFAMTEYELEYPDIKTLARASLEHAFLPGRSLWRAPDVYRPAATCAHDVAGTARPSPRCGALVRSSAKATVQWQQEARLRAFERRRR
ncbi:MAG: adenosine deaminase [Solirubrobacteraceae bacterium]|jgi:adenosine deaminase|nr:adenosine deaminase [Solirubrobacteraceae bacterium]